MVLVEFVIVLLLLRLEVDDRGVFCVGRHPELVSKVQEIPITDQKWFTRLAARHATLMSPFSASRSTVDKELPPFRTP